MTACASIVSDFPGDRKSALVILLAITMNAVPDTVQQKKYEIKIWSVKFFGNIGIEMGTLPFLFEYSKVIK